MKQLETEHYIFNYAAGTKVEQDIEGIAAHQEACASYMQEIYGKTPEEMNEAFVKYISLFKMDEVLEKRMAELAKDW